MGWYDERFTEHPKRHHRVCVVCDKSMWLPACKLHKYITCGGACAAENYARMRREAETNNPKKGRVLLGPVPYTCANCGATGTTRSRGRLCCGPVCIEAYRIARTHALIAERTRSCAHCGLSFIAKKSQIDSGQGRYCSQKCSYVAVSAALLTSKEAQEYAALMHKKAIDEGRHVYAKGEASASWKGGPEASLARGRPKRAADLRAYRRNNPHKVKEFCARRKGRKLGRLPRGTIQRIGDSQKWKCAVCAAGIKRKYHVDHITPLARGGEHEPTNIQLLCPTCNVRKSAKDPIQFMQERGFLL